VRKILRVRDELEIVPTITNVEPFGCREFATVDAFEEAYGGHEKAHYLHNPRRDSQSRDAYNKCVHSIRLSPHCLFDS
jgi:hypothetical protein